MGFIQREIERLHAEILLAPDGPRRDELAAAKQALSWATDPTGYESPHHLIMGIHRDSEDYRAEPHPPQFSGIPDRCG